MRQLFFRVASHANAKAGCTVPVFAPWGWSQEPETTMDGAISFVPESPGRYVIEVEDYRKQRAASNGNKYTALWPGSTYSFEVAGVKKTGIANTKSHAILHRSL